MKIYMDKPIKILQFLSRVKIQKCLAKLSKHFIILNNKPPAS